MCFIFITVYALNLALICYFVDWEEKENQIDSQTQPIFKGTVHRQQDSYDKCQ